MRIKVTLVLFLISFSILFSQNNKEQVKNDFMTYNKLIKNQKYDASVGYIIPEFFTYFPKEEVIKGMKQMMTNESIIFELESPKITKIAPIQKSNEKYYTLINYNGLFKIKFKNISGFDEKELKAYITYYQPVFEKDFGKENVFFNPKTKFFEIKSKNYVLASSDNGKSDWKFLQIDPNLGEIYVKIIPKEILTTFDIVK